MDEKLLRIQAEQETCLAEIDYICRDNGLEYSLAYGTFLGAIRHSGPIPWDDDVDICMPMKDARALKNKIQHHSQYFFQDAQSDPNVPFTFFKIRINNTQMIEPVLKEISMHHGVWIDVFPYVNAPASVFLKRMQYFMSLIWQSARCARINRRKHRRTFFAIMPTKIADAVCKICAFLIERMGTKDSNECFVISNDTFEGSYIDRRLLEQKSNYRYGTHCFNGPIHYDEYLKKYYGDSYMVPKRWTHIDDYSNVVI